jgi:hypothetical protein
MLPFLRPDTVLFGNVQTTVVRTVNDGYIPGSGLEQVLNEQLAVSPRGQLLLPKRICEGCLANSAATRGILTRPLDIQVVVYIFLLVAKAREKADSNFTSGFCGRSRPSSLPVHYLHSPTTRLSKLDAAVSRCLTASSSS